MKALFLGPSAYLYGGVQTWLDQTLRTLRGLGWKATLGLVEGARFHDADAYEREHPGHDVVRVRCLTGTREGRTAAVLRALETEKPDVLVLVNIADGLAAGVRAKRLAQPKGVRVIQTVHGFVPGQFGNILEYRGAIDRVVVTNRLTRELVLEATGENDERVGYAPYGAEDPVVDGGGRRDQGRAIRIAWVGRLEEPQKRAMDVGRVLRACGRRKIRFSCEIAGDGPSRAGLERDMADLVEAGAVRFRGLLSRQALYEEIYPQADVLLLTSTWETGPIVAWEAMRHGIVLVSTQYTGVREEASLVDGANCLLSPVGDVEAMAESIGRIVESPGLYERLSAAGREVVRERYSIEESGRAWDRELRRALEMPGRDGGASAAAAMPAGRLDQYFGARGAEWLRSRLGRVGPAEGPGDEWPHQLPVSPEIYANVERCLRAAFAARGAFDPLGPHAVSG